MNNIFFREKERFNSDELIEKSVIRKIRITASDGKEYNTNFYSLEAIIAVVVNNDNKDVSVIEMVESIKNAALKCFCAMVQ